MSGMIHDCLDKKFWFEFNSKMSNGMVSSTLLLWISFMLKFEMADLSMLLYSNEMKSNEDMILALAGQFK